MPRLHLITGHRTMNRSDEPVVLYCGYDADKANATREDVLARGEFSLLDKWTPDARQTRYASAANQEKARKKHQEIEARKAKAAAAEKAKKEATEKKAAAAFKEQQAKARQTEEEKAEPASMDT